MNGSDLSQNKREGECGSQFKFGWILEICFLLQEGIKRERDTNRFIYLFLILFF
jgi:hypothetical protein